MADEVRISATLQDDISAALAKIEARLKSVEDEVGKLGRAGAKGGAEFAAGANEAAEAADNMGDQARQAKKPVKDLGDEARKTGAKAAAGSTGLDLFAKKAEKAGKKGGGLGTVLKAFKFAGIITGVFALVGGLSALGAGAGIAIGGLSPMIGVLAGALPIFAAVKLSMLAFTLAAKVMEPTITRIKNQFTELGPVIARGGLQKGLDYFANSLVKLSKATGKGLSGLGGELGLAARSAGDIAKSTPFLNQVSDIFVGLRPITRDVSMGLLAIVRVLLNILQAALPMAQNMTAVFRQAAEWTQNWSAANLANGKMTAWLNKAYTIFTRSIGVLVDIFIGLFRIFRIGGTYANDMGVSIEQAAYKFRTWTGSAEGQARINQYFYDSLPALREMGKLLGMAAAGLGSLGANQNVAPLLAQIRTEFAPALGELVAKLSGQGGLGPALISAATAVVQLFAGLDFSALTLFIQGVAAVAASLVWLTQNVPGANLAFSLLLGTMLGFKLLSPVWAIVASGAKAYSWIAVATAGVGKLSLAQKLLGPSFRGISDILKIISMGFTNWVIPAIKAFAVAGMSALRALSIALVTTPIGWLILAIMAIVGVILLLWFKCAWFRDAVIAVWNAIKAAAVATWEWIKNAAMAVWNWLYTAAENTGNFIIAVWEGIKTGFTTAVNWISNAWTVLVNGVVAAAQWIWTGIEPVVNVIVTIFKVAFSIIMFTVETTIYIVVGLITLIAITFKAVWDFLVWIAKSFWEYTLKPIFTIIAAVWNIMWTAAKNLFISFVTGIANKWNAFWDAAKAVISFWWNNVVKPIFDAVASAWNTIWGGISDFFSLVWTGITGKIQAFWDWLSPIFTIIGAAGAAVWDVISTKVTEVWNGITGKWQQFADWISGIWDIVGKAGSAVWDVIKGAASGVVDFVKGLWEGLVGIVKGAWNFIANGWNGIPSITVPDWIPLIGGKTFSLPKLPTLWHGGEAPGGTAIVGEHGPEPLVQNGRVTGMVGMNGPEITGIPKGGYVVPNLRTLSALPGLAKTLPAGVARAVARSVPGYAGALGPSSGSSGGGGGSASSNALASAVGRLAAAVGSQMPPVTVNGGGDDIYDKVLSAYRTIKREQDASGKYSYSTGGR